MAVNYALLRYQADNIPNFDGNPKILQRYISSCENLLKAFQNKQNENDPINVCLIDTILGKLTHRAADLISSRAELNTWHLIKDTLIMSFSDQRSIDCLIQDLIMLKPFKNEPSLTFGMRIQDARSLLFAKLSATNEAENVKIIKIQHYDNFALKTFINGLPYNMQLVVRLKEPASLEQAMSLVREEENFIYFKNQNQNFANSSTQDKNDRPNITTFKNTYTPNMSPSHRPINLPIPNIFQRPPQFNPNQTIAFGQPQNNFKQPFVNNNFKPPFGNNNFRPPFGNNTFRPPFGNNNFRPPFGNNNFRPPFGNINFKPAFGQLQQPFRPQMQGFNQQNLRPFSNNSQRFRNNRPEPMDTSSGNTVIHHAINKPKFFTEELYNQETSEIQPTDIPLTNNEPETNYDQYYTQSYANNSNCEYSSQDYTDYDTNSYEESYSSQFPENDQFSTNRYCLEQEQNFTLTGPPNNPT